VDQEEGNAIEGPQTRGPNLEWFEVECFDTKAEVDDFISAAFRSL
jgi:hypothetical protein